MDFSDALRAVRDGKRARRAPWREPGWRLGSWVELARPGPCADGAQIRDVLICPVPGGEAVLFACSQLDILADDWELL